MTAHSKIESRAVIWTPEMVRRHLADAFRVLAASEGRIGHKRLRGAWTEYQLDYPREAKIRFQPTSVQIMRMEIVLLGGRIDGIELPAWLNGAVRGYPTGREVLLRASMASARRISFHQLCTRMGWAPDDTKAGGAARKQKSRERDRAAQIIANELTRLGVMAWG